MRMVVCENCGQEVDVDEIQIIQKDNSGKALVIDRNGKGRAHFLQLTKKEKPESEVGPAAAKLARMLAKTQAAREQEQQDNGN
jgi:hypothetical protein